MGTVLLSNRSFAAPRSKPEERKVRVRKAHTLATTLVWVLHVRTNRGTLRHTGAHCAAVTRAQICNATPPQGRKCPNPTACIPQCVRYSVCSTTLPFLTRLLLLCWHAIVAVLVRYCCCGVTGFANKPNSFVEFARRLDALYLQVRVCMSSQPHPYARLVHALHRMLYSNHIITDVCTTLTSAQSCSSHT